MRGFPNEIVLEQISARQPGILLWVSLFAIPIWGPRGLEIGLMCWPVFVRFTATHDIVYTLGHFILQAALIYGAIVFLCRLYTSALWKPRPRSWHCNLRSVWILMPLLLFHLSDCFGALGTLLTARSLRTIGSSEFNQMLSSLYQGMWKPLAGDSSWADIVCYSMLSFITPVLEEMLFSGLLANCLAKRFGIIVALCCTPVCFTLVHAGVFGFGFQLVPLFFAGLTYTLMRFYSGDLLMSVFGHLAVNFAVLFPKWIIAVMHFCLA